MKYLPLFYLLINYTTEKKIQELKKHNNSIAFPTKEGKLVINFDELINRCQLEIKDLPKKEAITVKNQLEKWK